MITFTNALMIFLVYLLLDLIFSVAIYFGIKYHRQLKSDRDESIETEEPLKPAMRRALDKVFGFKRVKK